MTRDNKIQILTEAQERAFKQIDLTEGCEMGTEEFSRLLNTVQRIEWILNPTEDTPITFADHEQRGASVPEEVQITPAADEVVSDKVQTEGAQPVAPTPATAVAEPQFQMTEVRAALAKARTKGVNVSDIVRSFGVSSFPEIDPSQYGAVMAKLEEAQDAT